MSGISICFDEIPPWRTEEDYAHRISDKWTLELISHRWRFPWQRRTDRVANAAQLAAECRKELHKEVRFLRHGVTCTEPLFLRVETTGIYVTLRSANFLLCR